jgi:hypothetical protein
MVTEAHQEVAGVLGSPRGGWPTVNLAAADLGTYRETAMDGGDFGSSGSIPSANRWRWHGGDESLFGRARWCSYWRRWMATMAARVPACA